MATGDDIGGRGEAIFYVRMTEFCGRKRPLFRPYYLGEKAATHDYLVELLGAGRKTSYFFAQVKATRRGYAHQGTPPRLKVAVPRKDVARMALYPAPTYVVGIDERREVGYIVSVCEDDRGPISGLPTHFPLNCDNLRLLWDEVRAYWARRGKGMKRSVFSPAEGQE